MTPDQPVFFYDLGSPECYLAAERVMSELSVIPEWEPVLARELSAVAPALDRVDIAVRASDQGLQPLRWPEPLPPDSRLAMLTATYAKRVGRAVAFSLAAFRQAFAGGRDLGDEATVLIAAAACEMHPTAVLKAVELRSVTDALRSANGRARGLGVTQLPAIALGAEIFTGSSCLADAEGALTMLAAGQRP